MKMRNHLALLVAFASVAIDCNAATPNHSLDPSARIVSGGREVQIAIAQTGIKAYINESNWTASESGMPKIDLESSGAKRAEEMVAPLRAALAGYDFDNNAKSSIEEALLGLDWFGATVFGVSKTADNETRSTLLDATPGQEMAFVEYEYGMSANFDAIEVNVGFAIASKQAKPKQKPIARLGRDNLLYRQWHRVVVPLQGAGKKRDANLAMWSANDGLFARAALKTALVKSQWMIKRGLLLTAQEANTLNKGKYTKEAGYGGFLLERDDQGTLLWAFGLDQWVLITPPLGR